LNNSALTNIVDEETRKLIRELLEALTRWTIRLNAQQVIAIYADLRLNILFGRV
jgi:hypothetical protein